MRQEEGVRAEPRSAHNDHINPNNSFASHTHPTPIVVVSYGYGKR
jgi:hypothetical protein